MVYYGNNMEITLQDDYNALTAFSWSDIPPFAVIMGKNGVGKSQLLRLIENSINQRDISIPNATISGIDIGKDKALLVDQWNISDPQVIGDSEKEQIIQQAQSEFRNFIQVNNIQFRGKKKRIFEDLVKQGLVSGSSLEDFASKLPSDFYIDEENLISHRLGYAFREYNQKFAELSMRIIRGNLNVSAELESFKEKNSQPPWDIFNEMMDMAGLGFKVIEPINMDKRPIYLYDTQGREIHWNNISSGEKTLIQLACWLLYKSLSSDAFPVILLLDEPDASLHPAMVKNLLSVITNSFVQDMGIKVLMSTHSPTTIALAPIGSIFELKKNPTNVEAINRDDAIGILSDGLVVVGVNTKYVFLEGKNDPDFYQSQYNSELRNHEFQAIPSLIFTPISVAPPGGVKELIKTVDRLDKTGLKGKVKGVIDLDKGNKGSANIEVLKRYSIENYIFDPLIVGLSLIYQGKVGVLSSTQGFTSNYTQMILGDAKLAQSIVDEVCAIFHSVADSNLTADKQKITVEILFGNKKSLTYQIPKWYVLISKADIEPNLVHKPSVLSSFINRKECLLVINALAIVFKDVDCIFHHLRI